MSYSLSNVKKRVTNKSDLVKGCYGLIYSDGRLSDNVKYGLWKYVEYRLKMRNRSTFNKDVLNNMISELLEYCCNKSYLDVSGKDVLINENSLLYEIKKAIYYGATKCLYDTSNSIIDLDDVQFRENIQEPVRVSDDVRMNKEELEDYFKDLIV